MALSQDVQLRILAAVQGLDQITHLNGALGTLKAAASGLVGALFVQELGEMVMEADKANKNVAMFSRTMQIAGLDAKAARAEVDDFAVSVGVSRNEMEAHIATLVRQGLTLNESMQLTASAFDTATAAGKSTTQAMDALQSAMVTGDSQYLNTLGIVENFDQTYRSFATNIGKTVTALSEQEKMQARMQHVMKYAAQDAGTMAAQMDGLTGLTSRYESQVRAVRRELGDKFIPVWESVYRVMLTNITGFEKWLKSTDAVSKVAVFFQTSLDGAVKVMDYLRARAVDLKPALDNMAEAGDNVVRFVTNFVAKMNDGRDGAETLRRGVDLVVEIVDKLSQGVLFVSKNLDVLLPALAAGAAAWVVMGVAAGGAAVAMGAVTAVVGVLTSPVTLVIAAVVALGLAWKSNFGGIREWTQVALETIQRWWGILKDVFGVLMDYLKEKMPKAWDVFKKLFGLSILTSPVGLALKAIPGLFDNLSEKMMKAWNLAKEFWGWLKGEASKAADTLENGESGSGNTRRTGDSSKAPVVGNDIATKVGNEVVAAAQAKLSAAAMNYVDRCAQWTREAWGKAEPQFAGKINSLFQTGGEWFKDYAGRDTFTPTARSAYKNFESAGLTHAYTDITDLKPGDILFYATKGQNHVGIYKGNGVVTGNNRVSYDNTGKPVGDVSVRGLGNPTAYVRPAEAQAAWGGSKGDLSTNGPQKPTTTTGGTTPADPAKAAAAEKAKQEAIMKIAKQYADQMDALTGKMEKAKTDKERASLIDQQTRLQKEVTAWINGEKEKREAFQILVGQRRQARENEAKQAAAAQAAQVQAEKENADLAGKKWEYRKAVATSVLKLYDDEVEKADGNAQKLLAIDTAWRDRVLAAQKAQATAEAEIAKQKLRDEYKSKTQDASGNPTGSESYRTALKKQLSADISLVDSTLASTLKSFSSKATQARTKLAEEAADEARQNAATVFGAVSSARQATLQNGVTQAQDAYDKEEALAEGNAQKLVALENTKGRALTAAKNKLVNQQTLDSLAAADRTYQDTKRTLEKSGGDVAALTRAWKEQRTAITEAGAAAKAENNSDQTKAEKDARLGLSRYRAEAAVADSENDLAVLENQLAAGQVKWEKAEAQRLALAEARINAQRRIELAGAEGNADEQRRINTRFDQQIKAERLASVKEVQEREIAAAALVAETATMQLDNQLAKGTITRAQYEEKNLAITLKGLTAARDAELRDTSLSEGQQAAIKDKYRQLAYKAEIEASQRRQEALVRAVETEEALELKSLKNRLDGRMMTEDEYDTAVRALSDKRLERERDAALRANQDGKDGVERIWRDYYLSLDALDVSAQEKNRQRRIAVENTVADTTRTTLENSLSGGLLSKQQYEAASLQLDVDRINRAYDLEVEKGTNTAEMLVALRSQSDAQIAAAQEGFAAKQRDRDLNLYTQQTAAYQVSLDNQVKAGQLSSRDRDAALLALQDETLDRQYQNEVTWGQHTTAELIVIWNKYLADKEALHLDELEQERQHALELESKRADTADKVAANRLASGDLSVEDYESDQQNSAYSDAARKRDAIVRAPGVDSDDAEAAWRDYWATVDKISLDATKHIADRELEVQKSELQNYLDALDVSLQNGSMTRADYDRERLQTQQDMLALQEKADLSSTTLTEEQKAAIRQHYLILGQKATQDSEGAKNELILKGQSELREAALAGQNREYAAGRISLDEYLRQRAATQEDAAVAAHTAEVKAAQGNADLILAADRRLTEARLQIVDDGLQTRTDKELAVAKAISDDALAVLEEQHNAGLVSESQYILQKARLQVDALMAEKKAAEALETDPAERAKISTRYTNAIAAVNAQATRDTKSLNRSLSDQTDQLMDTSNAWIALAQKVRGINQQISDIDTKLAASGVSATEKAALTAQKNMLLIEKYSAIAQTAVSVITDGMAALGLTTDEVAGQWASDLGSMVSDVTNFAMAIAKGDYFGAAIQVLSTIWNWFTRNAKAAKEAAEATKKYNEQFKFNKDGYGTRQVETYTTGFLFWQTTHYKESVDEASKDLALSFEDAVAQGVSSGMSEAVKTGDSTVITKNIRENLKQAAFKGLTEAFLNSASVAALIGPLVQKMLVAFKTNDKVQINAAIGEFKKGLRELQPQIDALVEAGVEISNSFDEAADSTDGLADSTALAQQRLKALAQSLEDAIKSGIESGARSGIAAAIKSGNTADLAKTIREQVASNLMDAIITTFLQSAAMKAVIEPAMNNLVSALSDADPSNDDAAYNQFNSSLDRYSSMAETFATRLGDTFRRNGLIGNQALSNDYSAQDAALTRYLTDNDPSNDNTALEAYRNKTGGSSGSSSSSYTIGSGGTLTSGAGYGDFIAALQSQSATASVMAQAGKDQLSAGAMQLQAAQLYMQASGGRYAQAVEFARMVFNNGGS